MVPASTFGVSTGNSCTGTVGVTVALADCPVAGPGGTAGGTVSGGPWGVATGGTVIPALGVTAGAAASGGPTGVLAVGICPVVPGPAGTGAGARSTGLVTAGVTPVSTGAGTLVAILSSFSYDTDIYLRQETNITGSKTVAWSIFSSQVFENTTPLLSNLPP